MNTVDKIVTNTKSPKSTAARTALNNFVSKIDKKLSDYFDNEIKDAFGVSKEEIKLSQDIWKHIKEHNLRPAKRLRGSFVFYGYKLIGGNRLKDIWDAAMSVELIHTALLMHDDFMDQDDTRRGLPTTHHFYKNIHNQKNYRFDALHYGESMAVNLGDIALFAGNKILAKSNFPADVKIKALTRSLNGYINTGIGQSYDVTLEALGQATENDIVNLHYAKTGIYTYENPLHIGAMLAGANENDLNILSNYAIPGGIAFQIQDDILGLFGDPTKTGKPAHSDLRQGKMTLLIIKALEMATRSEVDQLKEVWGNHNITDSQAQLAREIITRCGSLQYSIDLSIEYAKKAQKAIPQMVQQKWNEESINYLDGIAQYMIERDM